MSRTLFAAAALALFASTATAGKYSNFALMADSRGSSNVEAGYMAVSNINANYDSSSQYSFSSSQMASAWGEAFSRSRVLLSVEQSAMVASGSSASFTTKVTSSGVVLYNETDNEIQLPSYGPSFGKTKSYGFSGVSVDARVEIGAALSGTVTGWSDDEITIEFTPDMTLYGEASAGVNAGCAGVNVTGSVDALYLAVPITIDVDLDDQEITTAADLDLEMLEGKIKLNIDYCVGNSSKTLVDKSPYTYSRVLLPSTTVSF